MGEQIRVDLQLRLQTARNEIMRNTQRKIVIPSYDARDCRMLLHAVWMHGESLLNGIPKGAISSIDLLLARLHHRRCAKWENGSCGFTSTDQYRLLAWMFEVEPRGGLHLYIDLLCLRGIVPYHHRKVNEVTYGEDFGRIVFEKEWLESLNFAVADSDFAVLCRCQNRHLPSGYVV